MKDRFSVDIHNGQDNVFEAITLMRNGGTVLDGSTSPSGLVGITNQHYVAGDNPILPQTIFNVQSSGDSIVRFASIYNHENKLELLANGNTPASGLIISYNPNRKEADFSIVQPDNCTGSVQSFLTATNSNFVGIGHTRWQYTSDGVKTDTHPFDINSPLTIRNSGTPNSGTVALKEQASAPSASADFGKIYVKPNVVGDQTQSIYFLDDGGAEYALNSSKFDSFDGLVYGDQYGNTYGGWYTPRIRVVSEDRVWNTLYGYGAGYQLNDTASTTDRDCNTIIGALAGSGLAMGSHNTVLGCKSFTHSNQSSNNIIIGHKNITKTDLTDPDKDAVNNTIIIGTGLFIDEDPPDQTLAIGFGDIPLVTGSLGDAVTLDGVETRRFSVFSPNNKRTFLTVDSEEQDFKVSHNSTTDIRGENRNVVELDVEDKLSTANGKSMIRLGVSHSSNIKQTVIDIDPSGKNSYDNTINFAGASPFRPHVGISGDLRVLGAVRFRDGTSIESSVDTVYLATTGVKRSLIDSQYHFHLDFTDLSLANTLVDQVANTGSFFALQTQNNKVGKMSISELAELITSGQAIIGTNCNADFTNADNTIDFTKNEKSVFIGCDVATNATGWKHSIFIGTDAGKEATNALGLGSDTACTFIGYQAGYEADNVENSIFIGQSAGKNAVSSDKSIFIGAGAGEQTTNSNSIGIGAHALQGNTTFSDVETGSNNIEIIAGKDNVGRLMYNQGNSSNKLNLQNVIAGDTLGRYVSIGDARLAPTAPLEVRRDSTGDNGHTGENVQTWHNEDSMMSRVNVSGDFVTKIVPSGREAGRMETESWFGNIEGIMHHYIYAPASYSNATSGQMIVKNSNFSNGERVWIVNRDTKLDIHGDGAVGGAAYVVATRVNGEWRPIYVSCSGA